MTGAESQTTAHDAVPPAPEASAAASAEELVAVDPVAELNAALAAANARAQENYDQYLRARAELENVRRRSQEDVAKAHKYALEGFAEALVPVFDSLEKALGDSSAQVETVRAGIEITLRQLRTAFDRGRLTEINPAGQKFDPHRHEAVATVPGDGSVAPQHVATVLQKGWMIADRVLRPALVTVVQGT